ncbi:MAG: hypothetical protein M1825_002946 [Sarcosagium campestre]|nr:MAG: hypothetical protein M1825_002946 [Sarcosagium campestre]
MSGLALSSYGLWLAQALQEGDEASVAALLKHPIADQQRGNRVSIALFEATCAGNEAVVRMLLGRDDVDVNRTRHERHTRTSPDAELHLTWLQIPWTALQVAVSQGHIGLARLLLHAGAAVEAPPHLRNEAPLQLAAAAGDVAMVRLLLDHGAEADAMTDQGSAVYKASERGDEGMVRLLLDHGVDLMILARGGVGSLQIAAKNGHDGVIRLLLDKGTNVNASYGIGYGSGNALQYASYFGPESTVGLLLDRGADIESVDDYNVPGSLGWVTPLQLATARTGGERIVRLLLDRGADVDATRCCCRRTASQEMSAPACLSPLQLALARADAVVAQMLRRAGAKGPDRSIVATAILDVVSTADARELQGALHLAVCAGHVDTVAALLDRGINVEGGAFNPYGTPLQLAAYNGFEPVVRLLLAHGAAADGGGDFSALEGASRNRHHAVCALLNKHGAQRWHC